MNRRKKGTVKYILFSLVLCTALSACGRTVGTRDPEKNKPTESSVDTGFVVTDSNSYDSEDTCVFVRRDPKENTYTFLNLELSKQYTLSMDGTTHFYDKYEGAIAADQISPGTIVDISFLKSKKHLTSMKESSQAWYYEKVERFVIDWVKGTLNIGDEYYRISDDALFYDGNQLIDEDEVSNADILSFRGIDKEVLTVSVEKGHGYLCLTNDTNFIGGWIEVGQSQISRITEGMLLTVPEGSYEVNISHNGSMGVKQVVINRNKETALDIGDIKIAEPKVGTVEFTLSPEDAELLIDGEKQDPAQAITLSYGLHQVLVRGKGYQTITRYLRVGQASAKFDIALEQDKENSEKEKEKEEKSDKVFIDAPSGAEVYVDGNYIGISPCSFEKETGSHVITLRKNGYVTKNYTIKLDDSHKDASYSFAEMVEDKEPVTNSTPQPSSTEATQETKPENTVESTEAVSTAGPEESNPVSTENVTTDSSEAHTTENTEVSTQESTQEGTEAVTAESTESTVSENSQEAVPEETAETLQTTETENGELTP